MFVLTIVPRHVIVSSEVKVVFWPLFLAVFLLCEGRGATEL